MLIFQNLRWVNFRNPSKSGYSLPTIFQNPALWIKPISHCVFVKKEEKKKKANISTEINSTKAKKVLLKCIYWVYREKNLRKRPEKSMSQ